MSEDLISVDFKALDKGLAGLEKKLEKLDDDILKKVLVASTAPALQPMYNEVLKTVPVDTGALKACLKTTKKFFKKKKMITAGIFPKSINILAFKDGRVKNPAHYLHFTEYGTKKQPAQAYMRKAFEATHELSRKIITAKLLDVLRRLNEH